MRGRRIVERGGGLLCALLVLLAGSRSVRAQGPSQDLLPEAPSAVAAQGAASPIANASVTGTVFDVKGAELPGALVMVENRRTHDQVTTRSGEDGSFSVPSLTADSYRVTISADGFSPWISPEITTHTGERLELPQITLEIAPLKTSIDAISQYEVAEIEIKQEEHQRVLGVVPNFFVVYNWHAAPLTPRQKFRLALRAQVDWFAFAGTGITAGIEQAANSFSGYGQGASGFAKRYAAAYTDGFTGTLIGAAVLPSLLHQDPRYYYKGTGTIKARALYAISTVVICKGDNGKWQPNYSSILGDLASAGISNAYYPASNRHGASIVIANSLIGSASGAFGSLMQEFFLRRIMLGTAPQPQSVEPTRFLPE